MAALSLSDTPITFDLKSVAILNSSPMVVASILCGDIIPFFVLLPTDLTVVSVQQYTFFPSIKKLLFAIPCRAGVVPV